MNDPAYPADDRSACCDSKCDCCHAWRAEVERLRAVVGAAMHYNGTPSAAQRLVDAREAYREAANA